MKNVPLLLLAALTSSALAQEVENTYGKTEAQILSMGIEKWETYFTSKAGDSTAGMAGGYGIYADVARKRNQRLEKASPRGEISKKVRKLLADYGDSASAVGRNLSGGGTIWTVIDSEKAAELEDVEYAVLTEHPGQSKHMVVSTVKRDLVRLKAMIDKTRADKDASYFKYDEAKPAFTAMNSDFLQLVGIAKNLDRRRSDMILTYCDGYAKSATSFE